jgi:hypothetical protein
MSLEPIQQKSRKHDKSTTNIVISYTTLNMGPILGKETEQEELGGIPLWLEPEIVWQIL